jgi:homoserine O-acetyltransferase/O-succinyltransferase
MSTSEVSLTNVERQTAASAGGSGGTTAPWLEIGSAGVTEERSFRVPGPVDLVAGRSLPSVDVTYETYGDLDGDHANAVLICHAWSGDAHVAGWRPEQIDPAGRPLPDAKPGWWDLMVGPGKTIDTDRFFVICSNVLGGCSGTTGPSSIDPATGRAWGLRFPMVTIEDMVEVQARLLDHLGVSRLAAVTGGSMGGMQALQWAKRFPDRVHSVLAIATTYRLGAQAIGFDAIGRAAILEDPDFAGGDYYGSPARPDHGLALARMVGHITFMSDESMHGKFGRRLRERAYYAYDFVREFEVETYLAYQGKRFVERFDANTYLYMTKAMDYFDLSGDAPALADALADIARRWLVVSFSSDWLFPTYQARQLVDALRTVDAEVTFAEIESSYGHDAFLLEPEAQHSLMSPFLEVALAENRAEIAHRSAEAQGEAAL